MVINSRLGLIIKFKIDFILFQQTYFLYLLSTLNKFNMKNTTLKTITFTIMLVILSCTNTEPNKQDTSSEIQEVDSILESLKINTSTSTVGGKELW